MFFFFCIQVRCTQCRFIRHITSGVKYSATREGCCVTIHCFCLQRSFFSNSHSFLMYRVSLLPQILDVRNVMVVVSRWYGGILLGPDRFKHINNCARNILLEEGYAASLVRCSHRHQCSLQVTKVYEPGPFIALLLP